ncbi:Pentatricopeptide repeat-containing protein [Thalictrum thalictroides]|uniref:Pentatricopeptide repeat-containing protein n=1 Tax=Thalictrum thalictroides TaxID=46969 RepID=A0A7J6X8P4_THATH|nr:Pentatricopeptide repeat-containing protein [Thalictrum thalictroides]
MLTSRKYQPDNFTFPLVFKVCGDLAMIKTGKMAHCRVVYSGYVSNEYVQNSLIAMYMSCGEVEIGRKVFDRMLGKTLVSWNTMVSGYVSNGRAKDALMVFDRMMDEGVGIDRATVVSVLPACASLKDLQRGRLVHELVEKKEIGISVFVRNSLVDMYAKCGCIGEARAVFDEMVERDVVSWTAMMGGYVLNGDARSALALCFPMQLEGIRPNSVTVAALLSACISSSDLNRGKCLHGWIIRSKLESDIIVETSLIDLYTKCHRVDLSLGLFTKTSKKRIGPWNAIITGLVHNKLAIKAVEMFKQMQMEMREPNVVTLMSLLPAYADLADLPMAKNIHSYLVKIGICLRTEISTNLIDIYSKCGSLESAHEVFKEIPQEDKDIITWSTIIAGHGMHGHGEVAISFFDQMVQAGIRPNAVIFTSVLQACSHAGLVDEGLRLFKTMVVDHQETPRTDHYSCIIDLVGRAGRLKEAHELIKAMPLKPNHAVWGALLGSCVIHQNVELGEEAAKKLLEVEPDNTGNYILLSKLYAAVGRWEDAENVRIMINDKGLRKIPGCSSV